MTREVAPVPTRPPSRPRSGYRRRSSWARFIDRRGPEHHGQPAHRFRGLCTAGCARRGDRARSDVVGTRPGWHQALRCSPGSVRRPRDAVRALHAGDATYMELRAGVSDALLTRTLTPAPLPCTHALIALQRHRHARGLGVPNDLVATIGGRRRDKCSARHRHERGGRPLTLVCKWLRRFTPFHSHARRCPLAHEAARY